MTSLQEKINNLMSQKNMSAIDIERETGLNKNTIYSITSGASKNPSANTLRLLAKAFDIRLEDLISLDKTSQSGHQLSKEEMLTFSEATSTAIEALIQRKRKVSMSILQSIINDSYKYALEVRPPSVDIRYLNHILDGKYQD